MPNEFVTVIHSNRLWVCRFVLRTLDGKVSVTCDHSVHGAESLRSVTDRADALCLIDEMAHDCFTQLAYDPSARGQRRFWFWALTATAKSCLAHEYTGQESMLDSVLRRTLPADLLLE